jgi:membrane fusion protein (multidrug efflux system)
VLQTREQYGALQADVAGQRAKINQAQAAVQQARGSFAALQSGVAGQQAKQAQAATGIEEARGNAAALRAGISQQQAGVGQAQAALQGTATATEQISVSRAQAQSAGGKVLQARARVNELRLQLSYTRIIAPHDGVVSRKNVNAGQTVQNGQALMTVTDLDSAYVTANFKETQLSGMRVGSPVELEVDAYPGSTLRGHVASLSAGTGAAFSLLPPENASGNFTKVVQRVPVKIAIDDRDDAEHPLRLGMSVLAIVSTGQSAQEYTHSARRE